MSKIVLATVVAGALLAALAPAMAASRGEHRHRDNWSPAHLDDRSVPAKTYFEQMQRDGK
ncbi:MULTISPECIES: hypothetical protein [Rhodomicrobium]|uniref:hypothetical protein n=1 Tax=Rhodomicrobium TaxID=1068 RepID=UPI000B4B909B|nr:MULTISPECIES: hypothetical protein [Rhodomicrobium]